GRGAADMGLVDGHRATALALALVPAGAARCARRAAAQALALVLALAGVLGRVGSATALALALVHALADVDVLLLPGRGRRLLFLGERPRPRRHPCHHRTHRLGEVSTVH